MLPARREDVGLLSVKLAEPDFRDEIHFVSKRQDPLLQGALKSHVTEGE